MSEEKTETSQRKDLGPTEARDPCPGFFQVFHWTSSSFFVFSLLPSLSRNLDKQLRFSRTVLSRYAVFSDYSSLATRHLLYLFLSGFPSPYLSCSTKSVRCVLGLLLSCYPTFTLSLPLWFSISIPLVLSYVSLSSRSSNSKGPTSSSHLTSILRAQAHVQVRECRAGPGRPDLHTRAPSRTHART